MSESTRYVLLREDGSISIEFIEGYPDLKRLIGGYITSVTPRLGSILPQDITVFAHDEGLLLDLPWNVNASGIVGTYLVGPVLIGGFVDDEGEVLSIPDDIMDKVLYEAGFFDPLNDEDGG